MNVNKFNKKLPSGQNPVLTTTNPEHNKKPFCSRTCITNQQEQTM